MSARLVSALLPFLLANDAIANDFDEGFSRDEIVNFAEYHFNLYFNDCDQFVNLFADEFEYCDGLPCHNNKTVLMDACKMTFGLKNIVHSMTYMPAAFPNPLAPSYDHVAIKGKQTVWLPDSMDPAEWVSNPNLPRVPICFDHVIEEKYKKVEKSNSNTFGIALTAWRGFYEMSQGICDGGKEGAREDEL